jgi:uncharacterized protein YxjI
MAILHLEQCDGLLIRQRHELAELVGFETRNKYEIVSSQGLPIAFAAEQSKGLVHLLLRSVFGHWRAFEVTFFDTDRSPFMVAYHPFRWVFREFIVRDAGGQPIGQMVSRFSLIRKKFDVCDPGGKILLQVASPLWRLWTFPFYKGQNEVARISKKWSGLLAESFTDKDTFKIDFLDPSLSNPERHLLLAASIFIDLLYFERKAD